MNNQIVGLVDENFHKEGFINTANEIFGQPELWLKTYELVVRNLDRVNSFFEFLLVKEKLQIILTGAGTSAFIGEVLSGPMQKHSGVPTRAIPTTDLITHPELYFLREMPTLLISFGRSGNSPESVKAVELANAISQNIYHLIITCNGNGELAQNSHDEKTLVLILPPESDDKSLAMTGSFSSMLLTGLLIANIKNLVFIEEQVKLLSSYGIKFFNTYVDEIKKIAMLDFNRAVFLGSGLFGGIARESHLKLQELTDGKVICKHDSFLGFRHGPKAVIDDKTLIVYLFSNRDYSQQYEIDLAESVNKDKSGCYKVGVMEKDIPNIKLDTKIIFTENNETIDEEFLTIASVLFAQTLGFYKSIDLGLKPDSPSVNGMIHRVVQGVKLYKYNNAEKVAK